MHCVGVVHRWPSINTVTLFFSYHSTNIFELLLYMDTGPVNLQPAKTTSILDVTPTDGSRFLGLAVGNHALHITCQPPWLQPSWLASLQEPSYPCSKESMRRAHSRQHEARRLTGSRGRYISPLPSPPLTSLALLAQRLLSGGSMQQL